MRACVPTVERHGVVCTRDSEFGQQFAAAHLAHPVGPVLTDPGAPEGLPRPALRCADASSHRFCGGGAKPKHSRQTEQQTALKNCTYLFENTRGCLANDLEIDL